MINLPNNNYNSICYLCDDHRIWGKLNLFVSTKTSDLVNQNNIGRKGGYTESIMKFFIIQFNYSFSMDLKKYIVLH